MDVSHCRKRTAASFVLILLRKYIESLVVWMELLGHSSKSVSDIVYRYCEAAGRLWAERPALYIIWKIQAPGQIWGKRWL